jgi:hypothetical protein
MKRLHRFFQTEIKKAPRGRRRQQSVKLSLDELERRDMPSALGAGHLLAAPSQPLAPMGSTAVGHGGPVTYHGGPLLRNVEVETLYYGQAWSSDQSLQQQARALDTYLAFITGSSYMDILAQYGVGHGTFQDHDFNPSNPPQWGTVDDSQIEQMLAGEIEQGHLRAPDGNRLYVVFAPPGDVVTAGSDDSVNNFLGYHSAFQVSGLGNIYYAVIPYASSPNATISGMTTFQQHTIVLSHELAEAVTDPDTQTGWFDDAQGVAGEIGDLAVGRFGVFGGYMVQAEWSNQANGPVLPVQQEQLTAPALIGPSGTVTTSAPVLSWNAVAGADHYDVYLLDMQTRTVTRDKNVFDTSWTVSPHLVRGHSYEWWVRAVDGAGSTGPWSDGMSLSIAPLSAPTLLAPSGTITNNTPVFSWNAVDGASSYEVYLYDLHTGRVTDLIVSANSWTPASSLAHGDGYLWWVRALDSAGAGGSWSSFLYFAVAPLATPVLIGPSGSITTATPTFSWNAVSGATQYEVYVWNRTTGAVVDTRVQGTSWMPSSNLSSGSSYRWWVRALDTAGGASAWSSALDFSKAALATPTLIGPTGTADPTATFSWNAVDGASSYEIYVSNLTTGQVIDQRVSGNSWTPSSGLASGDSYRWWVRAFDASGGASSWSASLTFSVSQQNTTLTVDNPAAGAAYRPASGSLFGPNGPSCTDVEQGTIGDCWLLSSLAEVAVRAPADIRNMFTYDGTTVDNGATVDVYTVRFFDGNGTPRYVNVDAEFPAGGGMYDHPANGVLWVALAEKAYAVANGQGYVTTRFGGSDSYSALDLGFPSWALQAITGRSASSYAINPSDIAAAWNAGQLIVIATTNPQSPYIVPSHAYAVVGYNPSSSQPFEVYNPWGTNSSGWALGTYNGHQVYGLFHADGTFLSQNYASEFFGNGVGMYLQRIVYLSVLGVQAAYSNSANASVVPQGTEAQPATVAGNRDVYFARLENPSRAQAAQGDTMLAALCLDPLGDAGNPLARKRG